MSLQDTYSFNKKITSMVPSGASNSDRKCWVNCISGSSAQKEQIWPSDIEKNHDTPSNLTCFFQSTLLHLQGYRDIFWLILVCFLSQVFRFLDTLWLIGPSSLRFPSVFFPARLKLTSSRHRRIDPRVQGPCRYQAPPEVCGKPKLQKPSKLLKFPVRKFSHLFLNRIIPG